MRPGVSVHRFGRTRGAGSLIGLHPELSPGVFRNEEVLADVLTRMFDGLKSLGLLTSQTAVVLPQHLGLSLYLMNEWPWVTRQAQSSQALLWSVLDDKVWIPVAALGAAWQRPYGEAVRGLFLRWKAPRVAGVWQAVMSRLAEQFRVILIPGTVPLPEPGAADGRLTCGRDVWTGMASTGVIYGPDGALLSPPAIGSRPDRLESSLLFMQPRTPEPRVVSTPLGRLTVGIGQEATDPDWMTELQMADIIACPASPFGSPESDAGWQKSMQQLGALAAVRVMMQGRFFEYSLSGLPQASLLGEACPIPQSGSATRILQLGL
ncbi:MAG: hypothetical protein MH204_02870 [Fimbriimonadaceae bacterium]|nr:hypothetical protein [Fimbriimonadaceae bacterium]